MTLKTSRVRLFLALSLTLLLLSLAACARKAADDPALDAAPSPGASAETRALDPLPVEAENNGGYYVRVGDRLYFRRYGAGALEKTAVFGEFTEPWNLTGRGESELMALDLFTGKAEPLYIESGYGPLWYADGGFYLSERVNNSDRVVWFAADGSGRETLCPGVPLGVTEDGLLAVKYAEPAHEYRASYTLYREKSAVATAETDGFLTFAGLTDQGIFLLGEDADETRRVWQVTTDGALLDLGALPELEDDYPYYDMEPDRFLDAGGSVVLGVGYYAGTGHFLNDFSFVEATPGRENSVRALTRDVLPDEDGALPRLALDGGGRATFVPALPGELRIGWEDDEYGALEVWDDGAWRVLAEHFCPPPSDGYGCRRIVQHMERVGGTVYATLACVHASPADSIGWRNAYALLGMLYLAVEDDGTVRELDAMDCGAELFGNVWFIEGASTALWQQISDGFYGEEPVPSAYAIPIAEDAYWDGGWEAVFNGTTGLLPWDYGEGEADYSGFPVPDAEPAGALCLTLDRDGTVVALSRKAPEAALSIEFDVPERELAGAVETLPLRARAGDEDTPWFWAKLRALEDGVRVRVERTPEEMSDDARRAWVEGTFLPGETLCDRVLGRGEFIALRASLPWYPYLRVSVSRDGCYGSYAFGEDNYLHLGTEDRVHPELTLAAYPPPEASGYLTAALREDLSGTWLYRSPLTGEIAATLRFDEDGTVLVVADGESWQLDGDMDWLFAGDYQPPDLLCLRTEDKGVIDRVGFGGAVGDYLVELFRTDGEEILRLTQANNGDGALTALLPDAAEPWTFAFTFTRDQGIGVPGARRLGETFPAEAVRYDRAAHTLWIREAQIVDRAEDGGHVWRAVPQAPCLAYPLACPDAVLGDGRASEHPMRFFDVTVNEAGEITGLLAPPAEQG